MNDDTDKPKDRKTDAEQDGPLGGERLAKARRERQIAVDEIAKELHLDEAKVRALEKNEFDALGAPVFAKGHLRKYAHLVGVDHEDVLTDYYRLTRSQSIPPVVTQRLKPRRELTPGPWIVVIVVVVIIATMYWVLVTKPFSTDPGAGLVDTTAPAEDAAAEAMPAGDGAAEQPTDDPPPLPDTAEQEPLPVTVESEPTPIGEGEVQLSLTFIGDCWTEISDATGRRLFFALGRSGRTVTVTGQAPLSVLLGDAENVSLRVNGNEFTIADADRRGRTARMTIHEP